MPVASVVFPLLAILICAGLFYGIRRLLRVIEHAEKKEEEEHQ